MAAIASNTLRYRPSATPLNTAQHGTAGGHRLSALIYGDRTPAVPLGQQPPLLFFLGPCVIESEDFLWNTGRRIKEVCAATGAEFVLKASYDKANRTSGKSFRGIAAREGCQLLAAVGRELGVAVTTDVHSPAEAEMAAEFIDVLQIPAFLCRQTDLIQAAAATGRVVNVKKGQFLSPWDVRPIADKLRAAGNERFFFTERGVTFGYQNLVADMRSLYWMREAGYAVVFDATHSVQRPGGGGRSHGGRRRAGTSFGAGGSSNGLRRSVHGGTWKPCRGALRRAESDSPSAARKHRQDITANP